jgi:peptidoglycan/xylan/chitin deacetylase (PgdA/CDA1 family)/uncharacterized membrane protein YbhN (UPF0104 family)
MVLMPVAVKLRVAAGVLLGMALVGAPLHIFGIGPWGVLASATLALALGYLVWCIWPRFTWPIPARLLHTLARDEGVALSFDDGPTPGVTEALLDLLRAHGQKATFFLLVHKARKQPELVRRMIAEGHTVGLHGEDHARPFFRSAGELHASLARAKAELEAIAGVPVTLYRPSHGWKTVALVRAVARAGLTMCFWDAGVWDTDAPPLPLLVARLDTVRAIGAKVVVLHDGRGDEPGAPAHAPVLLEALGRWLPSLSEAPPPAPRRAFLSIAFGLAVTGLLVWTLRQIDLAALRASIARIPGLSLLTLAGAAAAATALQGLRFRLLLPAGLSLLEHIGLTFALHTGNILLPFRGGELVRPLYLLRHDQRLPLRTILGFCVADKAIEILCLVPFVLWACHVFATDARFASLSRVAWPAGAIAVAAVLALGLHQLRRAAREPGFSAASAMAPLGLSLGVSLLVWAANWLIFYCVVPDPRLALALLVGVNASLALPGLPAGFGSYEAAFVWVGALGGWPQDRLLAAALTSHAVQIVVTLVVGVPLLTLRGWPSRDSLSDGARAAATTAR